jgi:hypothetical protein
MNIKEAVGKMGKMDTADHSAIIFLLMDTPWR